MTGDLEREPVEGVDALDDLAQTFMPEKSKPETQAATGEEESEEVEEVEAEEEEEVEAEEEEEEEAKFTIKVDGKEITLTESELIERAQKGTDYSNKTMAVAEERKAVDAERAKVSEVRTQAEQALTETVNRLEAYSQYMQAQLGDPPSTAILDYDTTGYLRQREQYEARKGQLHEARAAIQTLHDEQARQRQAWIAEKVESTERALKDTLPGWNDDTLHELADYAGKLGLNPQSADVAMLEPGFWQLVSKAKAYDAVQAQKAQMKPKAQLAKVDKPQAKNQSGKVGERMKREAAFNKNPSTDTLAEFFK